MTTQQSTTKKLCDLTTRMDKRRIITFDSLENPNYGIARKLLRYFKEVVPCEIAAGWESPDGRTYLPEKALIDYLAKRERSGIPVRYVHATNAMSGRQFPIGASGMTSFPRSIRHTLAAGLYYDIDIVNAHPTFAVHMARSYGIDVSALEFYNTNRDECLIELMRGNNITKDDAKRIPLSLLNGGKLDYNNLRVRPQWLINFRTQSIELHNHVMELESNRDLVAYVKKTKGKDYSNVRGSVFNHILCEIEDKCLMAAVAELKKQGVPNSVLVLCFDGLMIPTHLWKPTPDAINKMIMAVLAATGLSILFANKPMLEGFDLSQFPDVVEDEPEPIEIVNDDSEAATIITKRLIDRELVKACGSHIYVKLNNIWINDSKQVDEFLLVLLSHANLMVETPSCRKSYSGFVKNVRACIPLVKAYTKSHNDPYFHETIYNSTIGKICFADGVFDIEKETFTKWELIEDPIYSTVKIGDSFRCHDEEIDTCIDELYNRVILPIFGTMEKAKPFLSAVARGIAGKVVDKQFLAILGERDCGKGVFTEALTAALGGEGIYTATASMENLLIIRNRDSGDTAKKQGWMMAGEHTRFLIMNEVSTNADDSRHKLNGDLLKRLVGGDILEGRNLYEQTRHFRVMAKPLFCCNDLPPFSSPDALQSAFLFVAPHKFVSKDMMKDAPINYRLCDERLKSWIRLPLVRMAFFHLLVQCYEKRKVEPLGDAKRIRDDLRLDNNDDLMIFNKTVRATNNVNDIVKISDLNDALQRAGIKMTGVKLRMRMENMGAVYSNTRIDLARVRHYEFAQLIQEEPEPLA